MSSPMVFLHPKLSHAFCVIVSCLSSSKAAGIRGSIYTNPLRSEGTSGKTLLGQ